MNNNDFEIILYLATEGERYSAEEFAATRAAEIEMAARLTPITPDTLDAAGWILSPEEEAYWSPLLSNKPCTVWVEPEGDNAIVEVEWSLEDQHIPFPDVATMHDLRELVRLLGGAQ